MNITDLFQNKTVLSFEVFPPKRTSPVETIYDTLETLSKLSPDFISVTYGAGGSDNCDTTTKISASIKKDYNIESVAHLPCIGMSKEDVKRQLGQFKENGIENILALRGDRSPLIQKEGDFKHASDLISFIHENGDFNVSAACYPEGHNESANVFEDIFHLREKVEAGASHLISQLFFDNTYFYRFTERCQLGGIHVPIEAGIMPVTNKKQIERMVTLCGVNLPDKFVTMMARYENNPEAMRDAGIAYAVNQIVDLISHGVDGIHLYTMNNPYIATKIYEAIHRLIEAA